MTTETHYKVITSYALDTRAAEAGIERLSKQYDALAAKLAKPVRVGRASGGGGGAGGATSVLRATGGLGALGAFGARGGGDVLRASLGSGAGASLGAEVSALAGRMTAHTNALARAQRNQAAAARTAARQQAAWNAAVAGAIGGGAGRLAGMLDGAARGALTGGALAAGVGLAGIARGVASNGAAEDTRLAVAGMMQAGGLFADSFGGFGASMDAAGGVMAQIRRDAARLPGEAEDYVTVLRGGMAGVIRAGVTNLRELTDFTNNFAAVANILQVDPEQAGRDLNLLESGRAGAQVLMWNRLSDRIGMTAEAFNRLRPEERHARINAALGAYQHAINASATSWGAIVGTTASHGTELLRVATAPLFERAKGTLVLLNGWLERNHERVEAMARSAGVHLTRGFQRALDVVTAIGRRVETLDPRRLAGGAGNVGAALLAGRGLLGLLGSGAGASVLTGVGGLVGGGALAGGAVVGAVALPLVTAIATGAVDVRATTTRLVDAVAPATVAFGRLVTEMTPTLNVIGVTSVEALTRFVEGAGAATSVLLNFQVGVWRATNLLMSLRAPDWMPRANVNAGDVAADALGGALAWGPRLGLEAYQRYHHPSTRDAFRGMVDVDTDRDAMAAGNWEDITTTVRRTARAAEAERQSERDRRRRRAPPGAQTNVRVHLEQTIHDASDPDRVRIDTTRALESALQFPIQSSDALVHR